MKARNGIWISPLLLIVMGLLLILTNGCSKKDENPSGSITDKDGNVYTSVTIGTQIWMVENLKTTKYNDGTAIPNVTDNIPWISLTTPSYCWYNNDVANKTPYGALYNWYAVNTGKLCPTGWHVPTIDEWSTLVTFVGGESVAAGKLKEADTNHWLSPNTGATNDYGFTALPGGERMNVGSFEAIGSLGVWETSSEFGTDYYHAISIYGSSTDITLQQYGVKVGGSSVRCLKN